MLFRSKAPQSPKGNKKTTLAERAMTFGQLTPAAESRSRNRTADAPASKDDQKEAQARAADSVVNEDDQKEFDTESLEYAPITRLNAASRKLLRDGGGGDLSVADREHVLNELLSECKALKSRKIKYMKSIAIQPDGSLKYHGRTKRVQEMIEHMTWILAELESKSDRRGKKVSNVATKRRR